MGPSGFLSTLPARGATSHQMHPVFVVGIISIHAPREGSDLTWSVTACRAANFYPRSPRGERHASGAFFLGSFDFYPRSPRGERLPPKAFVGWLLEFLSTLPARGATCLGM